MCDSAHDSATPLRLDPEKVIPAIVRNDLREHYYPEQDEIEEYLLDLDKKLVRYHYGLSCLFPKSKWEWRLYCRAIKMTEQLKEGLKDQPKRFLRIPRVLKDDLHLAVEAFTQSPWHEAQEVKARVLKMYREQEPLSVGGFVDNVETFVPEFGMKLRVFESKWVADVLGKALREEGHEVEWESDPSTEIVDRGVLRKDEGRIYVIIKEEWDVVGSGVVDALKKTLEVSKTYTGRVTALADPGATVDFGGVEGLVHVTELSWGRVNHPREIVNVGDEIQVKVLDIDWDKDRVDLGLKQLLPYPWDHVEGKYPTGSRVHGKVVSVTNYGAFVELERGVEALLHVSEMHHPPRRVCHPSKLLSVGDMIEAVVLNVDRMKEKISLSVRGLGQNP